MTKVRRVPPKTSPIMLEADLRRVTGGVGRLDPGSPFDDHKTGIAFAPAGSNKTGIA